MKRISCAKCGTVIRFRSLERLAKRVRDHARQCWEGGEKRA